MTPFFVLLLVLSVLSFTVNAFVVIRPTNYSPQRTPRQQHFQTTQLDARSSPVTAARRKVLLSRKGPYFKLERMTGRIEFGATANLVTTLDSNDDVAGSSSPESIAAWLQDERSLALSIWDPKLIQEQESGDNVYRLQTMNLQFVTLTLAPWVDMQMMTVLENKQPVFTLQSIAFDPNIQVLPGMRINAEALGIVIEVAGLLRPSTDGKSVTGAIAFQTTGELPPPMRLLPEPALKAASDAINDTVVKFAIQSFQKGAKENYRDHLRRRQRLDKSKQP